MKKIVGIIAAFSAATLLLAGCSSKETDEQLASLVTANSSLKRQNESCRRENTSLASENAELWSKNISLQAENDKLKSEISRYNDLQNSNKSNEKEEKAVKIYEDEYITAYFEGIGECAEFLNRESIVFVMENKTNIALTFFSVCVALDGVDVGDLTNYSSVSPKSTGKVHFIKYDKENSNFANKTPSLVSGCILVRDMNDTGELGGDTQYEFSFSNIEL